jgi:hypothetical protein
MGQYAALLDLIGHPQMGQLPLFAAIKEALQKKCRSSSLARLTTAFGQT